MRYFVSIFLLSNDGLFTNIQLSINYYGTVEHNIKKNMINCIKLPESVIVILEFRFNLLLTKRYYGTFSLIQLNNTKTKFCKVLIG